MATTLKYVVDNNGNKTNVLVPIKDWEEINNRYDKLAKKLDILTGIRKGLKEVKDARRNGKKLSTLKEFLGESNG